MSHQIPPTTNALSHSQRLRLMRSTRKLGDVLGTTPVINGSSSAAHSLHHSSSLRLSQKRSKALPRPLVLSLHALPASLRLPTGPTSPLSPTSVINMPSSNACPDDYEVDQELQARRKRMAKLTRTLGENIPPELVFNSRSRPSRPRSCSVDAAALAASFTITVVSPTEPTFQQMQPPVVPSRSSSLQVPSTPRTLAGKLRSRHGHASSLGMDGLHLQQVETSEPIRKSFESTTSISSTSSSTSSVRSDKEMKKTYRKQAGWSGEWNRQDMQEIMTRLRGLKA
jgi:hypothetical protein